VLQLGPHVAKAPTVFDDARAETYVDIEPALAVHPMLWLPPWQLGAR